MPSNNSTEAHLRAALLKLPARQVGDGRTDEPSFRLNREEVEAIAIALDRDLKAPGEPDGRGGTQDNPTQALIRGLYARLLRGADSGNIVLSGIEIATMRGSIERYLAST